VVVRKVETTSPTRVGSRGAPHATSQRIRVAIAGTVQGVGFRPFVYRLAHDLGLGGWVRNSPRGVLIEVEGSEDDLASFLQRIPNEKPRNAVIHTTDWTLTRPIGETSFAIRPSDGGLTKTAPILPDIATCPDCRREIFDAHDRRYRYPFTNCTNCGPRFSIVTSLPYDRPNTSMATFDMCPRCRLEYENPFDRRFHAQANACPECGPSVRLLDRDGKTLAVKDQGLHETAAAVRRGLVVAVKGMGGFHLMVNAHDDEAVKRLRERKQRDEKPFALMFPSLESVLEHCHVSDVEQRLLASPESPIVLLRARHPRALPTSIAPGNPYLGAMLPYTPLHQLLLDELAMPVVATSGNLSEEPICISGEEALATLGSIADLFLDHDRPIVRPVDDSVACVTAGRPTMLRRARGYAPSPFFLGASDGAPSSTLAVGGHLKNTAAISIDGQAFVSQHIGDLSTTSSFRNFERAVQWLEDLYDLRPNRVACDLHPDYRSTLFAERLGRPLIRVQHHHAHVLSCMAEHGLDGPVLGVCWDGTGYGPDGTVWGGEFLVADGADFRRAAHFRTFPLPGGEAAVKEPRRAAVGLLYELYNENVWDKTSLVPLAEFSASERRILRTILQRGLNTPRTSSAGRLFDAVASLLGIRHRSSFEGQAAMDLEFASSGHDTCDFYPFAIEQGEAGPLVIDWAPMIRAILSDTGADVPRAKIANMFHNTLVEIIAGAAKRCGMKRVVLTGGCFQNRLLAERAILRLRAEGFVPYWHERVPPNDGGISLGQIAAALAADRRM
jgi:hydrogenase maturation protein HypF